MKIIISTAVGSCRCQQLVVTDHDDGTVRRIAGSRREEQSSFLIDDAHFIVLTEMKEGSVSVCTILNYERVLEDCIRAQHRLLFEARMSVINHKHTMQSESGSDTQ